MDKTLVIDDRTFSFGHISATEAVRVEVAIARVIGEPLFKAFMDASKGKLKSGAIADQPEKGKKAPKKTPEELKAERDEMLQSMAQAAGASIGLLASNMDPDELLATMETVMKYVSVDGQRIISIDATFANKHRELWQVFIHALRFNFSDFFTGMNFGSSLAEMTK